MVRVSRFQNCIKWNGWTAFDGWIRLILAGISAILLVEATWYVNSDFWGDFQDAVGEIERGGIPAVAQIFNLLGEALEVFFDVSAMLLLMGHMVTTTYVPYGYIVRPQDSLLGIFQMPSDLLCSVLMILAAGVDRGNVAAKSNDYESEFANLVEQINSSARDVFMFYGMIYLLYLNFSWHLYKEDEESYQTRTLWEVYQINEEDAWVVENDNLPEEAPTRRTSLKRLLMMLGPLLAVILQGAEVLGIGYTSAELSSDLHINIISTNLARLFMAIVVFVRIGGKFMTHTFAEAEKIRQFNRYRLWQALLPAGDEPILVAEMLAIIYVMNRAAGTLGATDTEEWIAIVVGLITFTGVIVAINLACRRSCLYWRIFSRNICQWPKWYRTFYPIAVICALLAMVVGVQAMLHPFYTIESSSGEDLIRLKTDLDMIRSASDLIYTPMATFADELNRCEVSSGYTVGEDISIISMRSGQRICDFGDERLRMDLRRCDSVEGGWRFQIREVQGGSSDDYKYIFVETRPDSSEYYFREDQTSPFDLELVQSQPSFSETRWKIIQDPANGMVLENNNQRRLGLTQTGRLRCFAQGEEEGEYWQLIRPQRVEKLEEISFRMQDANGTRDDVAHILNSFEIGQSFVNRTSVEIALRECEASGWTSQQQDTAGADWCGGLCALRTTQLLSQGCARDLCTSWYQAAQRPNPIWTGLTATTPSQKLSPYNDFSDLDGAPLSAQDNYDRSECRKSMCNVAFRELADGGTVGRDPWLGASGLDKADSARELSRTQETADKVERVLISLNNVKGKWDVFSQNLERLQARRQQFVMDGAEYVFPGLLVWVTGFLCCFLGFWKRHSLKRLPDAQLHACTFFLCLAIGNFFFASMVEDLFMIANTYLFPSLPSAFLSAKMTSETGKGCLQWSFRFAGWAATFFFIFMLPRHVWYAIGFAGNFITEQFKRILERIRGTQVPVIQRRRSVGFDLHSINEGSQVRMQKTNTMTSAGSEYVVDETQMADIDRLQWTSAVWIVALCMAIPIISIALSHQNCNPRYAPVGEGHCLDRVGALIPGQDIPNPEPRADKRYLECEDECNKANSRSGTEHCIGYNADSAGKCAILMAAQSEATEEHQISGTTRDKTSNITCYEKIDFSHECSAFGWESALSSRGVALIRSLTSNGGIERDIFEAGQHMEALGCTPVGAQVLERFGNLPQQLSVLATNFSNFQAQAGNLMQKIAEPTKLINYTLPSYRLSEYEPVKFSLPNDNFSWLFGPSMWLFYSTLCGLVGSLLLTVLGTSIGELKDPTTRACIAFMNICHAMVFPLSLLGMEMVAGTMSLYFILNTMDLGLFEVKLFSTRIVSLAVICGGLSLTVAAVLAISRYLPIIEEVDEQEEELKQDNARGFIVQTEAPVVELPSFTSSQATPLSR